MKKFLTISLLVPILSLSAQTDSDSAAKSTEGDLQRALAELTRLRNEIGAAKIPLAREINSLEDQKIELTAERNTAVELSTGGNRVKAELEETQNALVKQTDYLHTALGNYIEELLGSSLHVGEVQLYKETLDASRNVQDSKDVPLKERFELQVNAINASFDRIYNSVGGYNFAGQCELSDGQFVDGNFAIVGPIGMFSYSGGAGLVLINPLSPLSPLLEKVEVANPPVAEMTAVTTTGSGTLFLDTKLGQAIDILKLKETIKEHIKKGGLVMYPILTLAFAAFIVSIFKAIEIVSVKKAKSRDLEVILDHLNNGRNDDALAYAKGVKGPVGEMLTAALEHIDYDDELIEEILYEKMLSVQPKLERMLPFIAVTAATAPLLGLLGTVTGMINTFKLITIFGTGDARQLSSGISEALITTEFGLIIAIPTLIAHSMLTRMTKSVLGSMERTALGFVNGLPKKT